MISAFRAGSRRKPPRRNWISGRQSGMAWAGDEVHCPDKCLPGVTLAGEHTTAFRGQGVETAPPFTGFLDPLPLQPPALLEAVQERIEGCDVKLHGAVRSLLDQLADLIAVARPRLQDRQDDQLRGALLELSVEGWCRHSCYKHIYNPGMRNKQRMIVCVLTLLAGVSAAAQSGLAGKWTGVDQNKHPVTLELVVKGEV